MGDNQANNASCWKVARLEDVCDVITDGSHYSPKDHPGGLPMASVKDLTRSGINVSGCRTISEIDFESLVRSGCQPLYGDVLIAKDGATCLDTVCEYKQQDKIVLLSSIAILRPGSQLCSGYLRYYLDSSTTKALLKSGFVSGSAIPRVVLKDFKRAPIPVPPLPVQHAIAHILGTLDDKIELNRQMNKTLELMARAIFKSWFVDFDPVRYKIEGHQPFGMNAETADLFSDSFVDSDLGRIPKGWKVEPVGDVVRVVGGSTPSTKNPAYWEGGAIHWATPKDLSSLSSMVILDTERSITELGLQQISSGLLPRGTVLLSSRAPIGYLAIAEMSVAINQGFIAMVCDGVLPNHYILYWVKENMSIIEGRANGTTFQEISKCNFRPIPIIVPPISILDHFCGLVEVFHQQIVNNLKQSNTLTTIRDTLLPKLLSGEVKVKDAEKLVEAHI